LPETNAQAYSAVALMMMKKSFARAVFERKERRIFKKNGNQFLFLSKRNKKVVFKWCQDFCYHQRLT
jgi:hypothetical protein